MDVLQASFAPTYWDLKLAHWGHWRALAALTLLFLHFLTQTGFKPRSHCLPLVSESSVSHGGKEERPGKYTWTCMRCGVGCGSPLGYKQQVGLMVVIMEKNRQQALFFLSQVLCYKRPAFISCPHASPSQFWWSDFGNFTLDIPLSNSGRCLSQPWFLQHVFNVSLVLKNMPPVWKTIWFSKKQHHLGLAINSTASFSWFASREVFQM